jgi:Predicted membrane-associated Zn-dependent proteases 1
MAFPLPRPWRRDSYPVNGYAPYSVNGYAPWTQADVPAKDRVSPIHLVLFFATLGTTTMAGALQQGADVLAAPTSLLLGLPFALTLMTILLFHEMGHYLTARGHGVRATLPYFIPGLPFFMGTFGAFIRMKSSPANRRVLFDVGAAGPWAGVLVAIPAVMVGLALSEVRPLNPFEGGAILGDSFLFSALARVALGASTDDVNVILHPIALAGWLGLFVTFLNLLPVGQLDGGHVTYSLFGSGHRWIARAFLAVIALLGFQGWPGWFGWVVLVAVLGIDHPPTPDSLSTLDARRKFYAWCTVGLFVVTFMPVPVTFTEPPVIPQGEAIPIVYHSEQPARPLLFLYRL